MKTDPTSRRRAIALGASLLLAPFHLRGVAAAETWPTRPINLIVPYAAGGPTDVAVRALAVEASKVLGQPIVIENRAGANGTAGATGIARAKPDGYTLAILPASVYREPHINKVQFEPTTSFSYVVLLTGFVFGLVVRDDAPWKTFEDFVADARANPGKLNVGAGGGPTGSPSIGIEEMAKAAGIEVNGVPFRGDADVAVAILGGHIDAASLSGVAVPHVESGKMRYLAAMTRTRMKRFPDTPTLSELGVPVWIDSPYGIAGPADLDPEIVEAVHDAFKTALESGHGIATLDKLEQQVDYKGPEDYRQYAEAAFGRERERVAQLRERGVLK